MFSFDTNEEMYEWLGNINRILSSLQKWNRILYEKPEKSTENVIESEADENEVSILWNYVFTSKRLVTNFIYLFYITINEL